MLPDSQDRFISICRVTSQYLTGARANLGGIYPWLDGLSRCNFLLGGEGWIILLPCGIEIVSWRAQYVENECDGETNWHALNLGFGIVKLGVSWHYRDYNASWQIRFSTFRVMTINLTIQPVIGHFQPHQRCVLIMLVVAALLWIRLLPEPSVIFRFLALYARYWRISALQGFWAVSSSSRTDCRGNISC